MIWSIIYHSWLGFVLLIWANVVWIKANKRGYMMISSPFLVIYAVCLLIINYVYGMKFSNDELPPVLNGVNMQQIGLIKYEKYAVIHLLLKSLLTIPFWLTMRTMFQEKLIMKHKRYEEIMQKILEEIDGRKIKTIFLIKRFCLFGLMWIIVLTFFVIAVNGEDMSLLRIINMSFFLFFVLLFQLCFNTWLRLMRIFWYTLIIYSMTALMIIYVHQFDDFPEFPWLHSEIGLRKYCTRILGIKLLSFTAVIILTGIQINHFHATFLRLFQKTEHKIGESSTDESQPSVSYYKFYLNCYKFILYIWYHIIFFFIKDWEIYRKNIKSFLEKILVWIEIHFYKFLFVALFWEATKTVRSFKHYWLICLKFSCLPDLFLKHSNLEYIGFRCICEKWSLEIKDCKDNIDFISHFHH